MKTKIFCASAIGGFIGSLVALNVNNNFWWVGTIIGFISSYIIWDIKQVYETVKKNLTRTSKENARQASKNEIATYIYKITIFITPFLAFWIVFATDFLILLIFKRNGLELNHDDVLISIIGATVNTFGGCTISLDKSRDTMKILAFYCFAPIFIFWTIPRGIWWLIGKIPIIAKFTFDFLSEVIRIVNYDMRLLCGINAAIGATIGFLSHHAIIGALAGGIFGLLFHVIISRRRTSAA